MVDKIDIIIEKIRYYKQTLADLRCKSTNLDDTQKTILRSVEGYLAYLEKLFKDIKGGDK
jgi:hypothetical protein